MLSTILLWVTPIQEDLESKKNEKGLVTEFVDCLRLLGKPIVLLSFLAIVCHVGIDVGTNTTAPKLLMERVGMTLNEAAFATSLYFIFRTIGALTGSFSCAENPLVLYHLHHLYGIVDGGYVLWY